MSFVSMNSLFCKRCRKIVEAEYQYISDLLDGSLVEIYGCVHCGSKIQGPPIATIEDDGEEDIL